MKHFIVDETQVNERLDKFLTEKIEQSRSQIKKAILNGLILVNDKPAKVHQFLHLQDKVSVSPTEEMERRTKEIELTKMSKLQQLKEKLLAKPFPKKLTPKIIHKNADYLIIEKPAKLLVHETPTSTVPTLVDWLVKKFPKIRKIADSISLEKNDQTFRPGIVHRLDRDVSGIMLIALNQDSFEYYKSQFQKRIITKKYTALVHGQLTQDEGTIDFEIGRSAEGGRMAAHPAGSGKGRASLTNYKVLERYDKATLVEVELLTGRTNQIRVHFFALQYPIVGDHLYKYKEKTKLEPGRIMLHARELTFTDMQGEKQTFEAELPEEFKQFE